MNAPPMGTFLTLRLTTEDERILMRLEKRTGIPNWPDLVRIAIARLDAAEEGRPDAGPEGPVVTSVRVEQTPGHDRVSVWNRHGLAGHLVVRTGDGDEVARRLRYGGGQAAATEQALGDQREAIAELIAEHEPSIATWPTFDNAREWLRAMLAELADMVRRPAA